VSRYPGLDAARDTYDTGPPPLLGCAASGGGAAEAALAMKEFSPDMMSVACSRSGWRCGKS
jgi:hypothetical protein